MHFQNNRVQRDEACYTCHTTHSMFGDVRAKLNGMRHLYVNYLGTVPDPITLYESFSNRECPHCHGEARNFEAQEFHLNVRGDLERNEVSCLDCHGPSHDITELETMPFWELTKGF